MSEDRDTDPTVPTEKRSASRRRVLKALGVGGAAVVASRGVPDSWTSPRVVGGSVAAQAAPSLPQMSCSLDLSSDAGETSPNYVSGYGPHVVTFVGGADQLEFDVEANLGNGSDAANVAASATSDSDGVFDLSLGDQTASAGMVSFGPNGYQPDGDGSFEDWLDGFTVTLESDGFENCEIVVSFVQDLGD